jgi:hypothetical protein
MKIRLGIAFTLALGLTWLITWAVAVQGVAAQVQPASSGGSIANAAARASDPHAAGLNSTADITFTPAFTAYLPAVFRDYQTCTAVPTLLNPANGSSLDTLNPLYRWDNGNDLSTTGLRLQVAKEASFATYTNYLWDSGQPGIHEFRFSNNLDPATVYYWRAWLVCGSTPGSYSEVWSFTTGSGGPVLPAVTLTSPANGSTVPASTVILRWSAVNGAIEYVVRWRKVGESGHTWAWVTGTQYTIGGLSANTTYEWWVAARNSYAVGANSATWQFTTPAGLSPGAQHSGSNHDAVVDDSDATVVLEGHSRQ